MNSRETITSERAPPRNNSENSCRSEITTNGHKVENGVRKELTMVQTNGTTGIGSMVSATDLKQRYNSALANDNIVIVEASQPTMSSVNNKPQKSEMNCNCGGQPDRASRTIRSLADAELPRPDVVRRAKDIFETLATKHRQETQILRNQSAVQEFSKPKKTDHIGRSQSMLVLSGQTRSNGAPLVVSNDAIYDVVNGFPKYRVAPPYQRSCSELDKFFQNEEEDEDDDLWERHAQNDRGSPVSPEVIQKIRGQGTCVKFFGSNARVVENEDADMEENVDDLSEEKNGYLLEYPYELYHSASSSSMAPSEDNKPKIIGTLTKNLNGSCSSSVSSAYGGRETPSPAPASPYGTYGWYIGGSGVSLDDIRASLGVEDSDGSRPNSALGSSYIRLKQRYNEPLNGNRIPVAMGRCHGKWMKNPYWQGSYYVIYDFTQKQAETQLQINGI